MERGYPQEFINTTLSEVKFQERKQALFQRNKTKKRILPFATQYHPAVPSPKEILTRKWYVIQQQPLLNQIFEKSPIISFRKGRLLKDILVRAKLQQRRKKFGQKVREIILSFHLCPCIYAYIFRKPVLCLLNGVTAWVSW